MTDEGRVRVGVLGYGFILAPEELDDRDRDELASAARATVGDELRCVTYFTGDIVDQLYLRDDLRGRPTNGFETSWRLAEST